MKRALLMLALVLAACSRTPESTIPAGVDSKVDKLFTVDGITVYRFVDNGHYVYFTSRGDVKSSYTDSCGKHCTHTQTVQTLGVPQ